MEKHLPIRLHAKGKPVRISHLMSHTSGIPATAYDEASLMLAEIMAPFHLNYSRKAYSRYPPLHRR